MDGRERREAEKSWRSREDRRTRKKRELKTENWRFRRRN